MIRRALRAFPLLVAALAFAIPASAEEPPAYAIPPGQEKLVLDMAGGDALLPGGCRLNGASIDKSVIVANYACKGGAAPTLELRHVSVKDGALASTSTFSIAKKEGEPPAELVEALAARIKKQEEKFRWVEPRPNNLETPTIPAPPPPGEQQGGLTPEQSAQYEKAFKHYVEGRGREALAGFLALAKENPRGEGVLGMVVASLAATTLDPVTAEEYGRRADEAPGDPLAQFMAGVAAHYAAHQGAANREQKDALYSTALRYLERARPALDFEARLYIYLAVSHFRLGHQAEAEELIEKGALLGSKDPDVFYCRAEVFQHVNVERSISDIDKYMAMIEELKKQGVKPSENKYARVLRMREHLLAVSRGEAEAAEIFDPISKPLQWLGTPRLFALGVLGVGGFGWLAVLLTKVLRRRAA